MNADFFNQKMAELDGLVLNSSAFGLLYQVNGAELYYDPFNDMQLLFDLAYRHKIIAMALMANDNKEPFPVFVNVVRKMLLEKACE